MSDLIRREDAINAISELPVKVDSMGYTWMIANDVLKQIDDIPSAEPEMFTIEEVSNQLGCATVQSALYWFEFLKTLDSLGFAIVRKETR